MLTRVCQESFSKRWCGTLKCLDKPLLPLLLTAGPITHATTIIAVGWEPQQGAPTRPDDEPAGRRAVLR